ncbi:hypothetical protein C8A05DRAFT_37131 [Staphylotrichum tortipilum]|uniref:Amidoligase enzyme n=1 Tax=Staphylotrichum tortipilum TaxID=2831512 RepID=A0AAN6MFP1_9PEZI|nr:hypothetical protein C8A05DRAFT_37131 [Staphylotrichum longicolle]
MPHFVYSPEPAHRGARFAESTSHYQRPSSQVSRRQEPARLDPPDFLFCVALGLVVRSRKRDHKTAAGLEDEISAQLTRAGIANHISSNLATPISSREWSITSELSIRSRPNDHHFGMKLVSPFSFFSKRAEAWQADIRAVLRTLNAHFELTTTHQCFTHVHIAPASGYWELSQAKSLARSALYFERCLDALVPPYRRRSVWAKSNRNNVYFQALSMTECFTQIDAQTSFSGLAARMSWCDADSPTGVALGAQPGVDFQHSTFRWNFVNLNEGGGLGTVAYRQPPGSTSGSEVISWVMLVGCLARLCCGPGGMLQPGEKPKLKSLGEWLIYEAEWSGLPHKSLLKDLVRSAVPVTPTAGTVPGMDADAITIDEDQRLRLKANDRDVASEKYRRLIKHL